MSEKKIIILALDSWVSPPDFSFNCDVHLTPNGQSPDASLLEKANILMTSGTPVTASIIEHAPELQLVACNGVGTNHVDTAALKKRGLQLCHVPAQNTDSVSEHAFALYYALRRKIIPMHHFVMNGKLWPASKAAFESFGAATRTNSEETLVSGSKCFLVKLTLNSKNIRRIGEALGMKVIVAERKGSTDTRSDRVSFNDALKQGTIFMVVTPLDATTENMIGEAELLSMDKTAFLINIGRGGVVNESALVSALRQGQIAGAGVDVFMVEPTGTGDSPLLDESIPNLVLTPHLAWYSTRTIAGTIKTIKANLEAFANGTPQNLVEL